MITKSEPLDGLNNLPPALKITRPKLTIELGDKPLEFKPGCPALLSNFGTLFALIAPKHVTDNREHAATTINGLSPAVDSASCHKYGIAVNLR
jgi:hypothetical protein